MKSELVTFTLENSDGQLVSSWGPGQTYTLTTASEAGEDMQAFVHASIGVLNISYVELVSPSHVGFQSMSCENAWGSLEPGKSHPMQWKAPTNVPAGGLCAVFSAAQAVSGKAAYHTNAVRLPAFMNSIFHFLSHYVHVEVR